jgi:hypothetical protein
MSGRGHRQKGEREIVDRHSAMAIHAERYPLSGASRFRGSGRDRTDPMVVVPWRVWAQLVERGRQ